jgi:hypothetical protein
METQMKVTLRHAHQEGDLLRAVALYGTGASLTKGSDGLYLTIQHHDGMPLSYSGGFVYELVRILDFCAEDGSLIFHGRIQSPRHDTRLDYEGGRLTIISDDLEYGHLSLISQKIFSVLLMLDRHCYDGTRELKDQVLNDLLKGHMQSLWQEIGLLA